MHADLPAGKSEIHGGLDADSRDLTSRKPCGVCLASGSSGATEVFEICLKRSIPEQGVTGLSKKRTLAIALSSLSAEIRRRTLPFVVIYKGL